LKALIGSEVINVVSRRRYASKDAGGSLGNRVGGVNANRFATTWISGSVTMADIRAGAAAARALKEASESSGDSTVKLEIGGRLSRRGIGRIDVTSDENACGYNTERTMRGGGWRAVL
jgi:hypothetical protein